MGVFVLFLWVSSLFPPRDTWAGHHLADRLKVASCPSFGDSGQSRPTICPASKVWLTGLSVTSEKEEVGLFRANEADIVFPHRNEQTTTARTAVEKSGCRCE